MVDTDSDTPKEPKLIEYIEERNFLLQDVPYADVKKAWFTLSHLLLDDDARVLDMGCEDGQSTYIMAALNPKTHFIGVNKSQKTIREAKEKYQLHNLEYKVGDISGDLYEPESIDAIINSFTLHQVFSNARYNERIVSDTLRKQFTMLKNDGIMFIRDYAKPPEGEFVLIEMHDEESYGEELEDLSEVDLLIWYSEHAQPKQDPGCGGFFLEELPARFPRTRLFRLPSKWAYEFIMRKDNRELWDSRLPFEYTFYTEPEFKRELRNLGARVQYSAPHWDNDYIRENFEGHFRLINSEGDALGDPPTSFIAIARKQPERSSLNVQERRITTDEQGILDVKTLRDQHDGRLIDVVTRGKELAEILPYHISEDGRLYIYLHDGVIRGIPNSVRRSGSNIDGREWSGHMLEAITTDYNNILNLEKITEENSKKFAKTYIGLNTKLSANLEKGPAYYPDPNYIDERIHSFFIQTQDEKKVIAPKKQILETHRFREKGVIKEFNAQTVLDAITIGLIPNARLELQILSLMQHVGIKAENWISKEINIASGQIKQTFKVRDFLRKASANEKRFKEVKGSAGQLKTINSIFVEEGQSQGGLTGISSEHVDFVLSDEKTINTAVVLPLTKSAKGDIHAGCNIKQMPVPQRFEGNGLSISAPQYNIPKEIKNYRMLKQFIAEKFGVTPNMVLKLGESYFSHIGITPERIHPFAVIAPPATFVDPTMHFIPFYQYMLLWKSISKEQNFMTTVARAYRYLPEHMKAQAKHDVKLILDDIFKEAQPDWSMPASVAPAPAKEFNAPSQESAIDTPSSIKKLKERTADKDNRKKKKEKKRKHILGFAPKIESEQTQDAENSEDPDILEEKNKKKEAAKHLDMSLIEDFEAEIDEIRQAIEEELDDKPKPEEW